MTIPPLHGGMGRVTPLRLPVLTAPVSTGVPPVIGEAPVATPQAPATPGASQGSATARQDPPIALAGRLDAGDALPDTTQLALALEAATRALQGGRADLVLTELDAVWSNLLASDSPWYLRAAALQLLGRIGDAEQVMRAAIEQLPRSAALLYLLGVHCAWRGQHDAARLANDHALTLHPTEPLLWLQRAALSQHEGLDGTAAAILGHVHGMEPSFPADGWLATLVTLSQRPARPQTPTVQRALERLTPSSVSIITDAAIGTAAPPPSAAPTITALDSAVRYGLTLLESPTLSARTATHVATDPGELTTVHAGLLSSRNVPIPPGRTSPMAWEVLVLAAGVIAFVVVPPLRLPAIVVCGFVALLAFSRRLR